MAKLAKNNKQIKLLMREKENSDEKCGRLKDKLSGLKQQVDGMVNDKFEAIMKCQKLEMRLKQA